MKARKSKKSLRQAKKLEPTKPLRSGRVPHPDIPVTKYVDVATP
jgi:hypothetical protein